MKLAPRYTFRSGEMCPHGEPDCLCDVIIDKPVEINTRVRHWFWENALEEVDDDLPNERNIVELAAIVFGMYGMFQRHVMDQSEPTAIATHGSEDREIGPQAYRDLPREVRGALRNHYLCGTPWRVARIEMDGLQIAKPDMVKIYNFYANSRHGAAATDKERSKRTMVYPARTCRHCGIVFSPRRDTATSCSERCNKNSARAKRRAAKRAANETQQEGGV